MTTSFQVTGSVLLVAVVLWLMWRGPAKPGPPHGWTPLLALGSAWSGLLAVIASGGLWVWPYPDRWLPLSMLLLNPGSIAAGVLVLWVYRGQTAASTSQGVHRLQAWVGIGLGLAATCLVYVFVMTHTRPG